MKYAAKTITGIRKQNQDAVFIPESGMIAIAAVADGMGGHNAGDIASALDNKRWWRICIKTRPELFGSGL